MVDYLNAQVGAIKFPLATSTGNTALFDCDRALLEVINFIAACIRLDCQARWNDSVNQLGLTQLDGYMIQTILPRDPIPTMMHIQDKFPLLAVYRTKARYEEFTVNHVRSKGIWRIDYVLPPLNAGQTTNLFPYLAAVEKCLVSRLMLGFHPLYMNGKLIFGESNAYIDYIRLTDSTMDNALMYGEHDYQNKTGPFLMLRMEMECRERDLVPDTGFEVLDGVDATIDVATDGYADVTMSEFTIQNLDQ